ncbi:MAG TPA: hypothetical protein VK824_05975, partial [Planctomycetota bacterium]|nr:hypothetical protein [Planctomycetota bacterium]
APLTGIALDLTTPGVASPHRVLCVTNGMNIARIDVQASCAAGAAILEPASFAFPTNPFSVTGGPLSGLAFSGHGVKFGAVTGPVAQLTGSEIIGAATAVTMTGAAPGAALVFSGAGGALCPPMPGPGGVMLVVAPTFVAGPYAHLGTLSLPVVIPAGAAAGTPTFLQFINQKTAGGFEATQGLLMTTSRP